MISRYRFARGLLVSTSVAVAAAATLHTNGRAGEGLLRGLWGRAEAAPMLPGAKKGPYALAKATMVQRTLELVVDEYVDLKRAVPKDMLLAALNSIQRDVAQVLVQIEPGGQSAKVIAEDKSISIRVDDVAGPWDVLARLRTVLTFLEGSLKDSPEVDLRDIEYAACNGILRTLDPHSVLFTPEAYRDFNVGTSGKFGGLGIVIAIRDKMLTVMNTMPGTPAANAGLMRFDRIVQINGESTTTMGISEAVQRLRGDPKTDVVLHVHRDGKDGWTGTHEFKLTRELIHVSSVESKALDDGIGYVRLKQFAESTSQDMSRALAELKSSGHDKGLVLDLRGNPGGLLDQAIKVVDAFVKEGQIVITDGRKEGRHEDPATDDKNEPEYPIVVLLNPGSASASEIVAGALKNLDRAVIVGETSFGKGSVQKVERNIPPEGAALKLTIAQYLTPGDISIQGVGITPDIELTPMTVDLLEMSLTAEQPLVRERDLAAHLTNGKAKEGGRPMETLRYSLSREDRNALRERNGDPDDQFALDFQIAFARKLATAIGPRSEKRAEAVRKAKGLIESTRTDEIAKIGDELGKLGVDWSDAKEDGAFDASKVKVVVETSRPGNEVAAGEAMELKVTVTNDGAMPLYRVRAKTKSDAGIFDGKELVFGKLAPGASRSWTTPLGWCEPEGYKPGSSAVLPKDAPRVCKLPKDTVTRADAIKVVFEEAHDHAPPTAEVRTTVKALPRPAFAYSYQVIDDVEGNGDGALQIGERASMWLTVKNVGEGKSQESEAAIKNLSGDGLLLHDARFDLSNMAPGEERRVRFTFDVQPALKEPDAKLQLTIFDTDLRESAAERVVMPLRGAMKIEKASGLLTASDHALSVLEAPLADETPFAQLPKDGVLPVTGAFDDFLRVDLGGGRYGFVRKGSGLLAGGKPSATAPKWSALLTHSPPTIQVDAVDLSTRTEKAKIKGVAIDGDKITDLYIFVGGRKVFYRSNRGAGDSKREAFDLDVPLRPGTNFVTIFARESAETVQRKVFVIRRDGAAGELLETPKLDDDALEMLGGGGD
ncbi:MAG: MXAN_5808 family serine peptidase [Polyangiales bacterium]